MTSQDLEQILKKIDSVREGSLHDHKILQKQLNIIEDGVEEIKDTLKEILKRLPKKEE